MLLKLGKVLHGMQKRKEEERGFTLIELLVVVIIIGILAAIAIPTFLSQRERAQDAAAKSDLRNAASAQSSFFAGPGNGTYADTVTELETEGFRKSANVGFVDADIEVPGAGTTGDYCMTATSASTAAFHIGEGTGGVQTGACP